MGHGGCGGIAASLANEQGNPAIGEFVTHWVKPAGRGAGARHGKWIGQSAILARTRRY
ncbi:MAG: hypothetical protein R3C04_04360 [Hyphomonas sp.]